MSYGKPWRPPQARVKTSGPWKGMRLVARGLGVKADEYLFATGNGMLDESGGYGCRPGAKRQNSSAVSGTWQLMYEFRKKNGTLYRVAIISGEIYTFAAGAYTKVVSTANLGTDSVTLSTTARCYAITLNDLMVITDGVNKPFTWDGASGASHTATIAAASVWYGQPTVYYAKAFGILNTDRLTIEWSDENNPAAGYGAPQSWTLGQTSSVPLVGIRGTNEALYYWRIKGRGLIRGPVDDDFTTSGTQDALDIAVGLGITHGHQDVLGRIWFVDQEGKLWRDQEPLWEQYAELFPPQGTGSAGSTTFGSGWTPSYTQIHHLQSLNLVIVSLAIGTNTNQGEHFVFDAASGSMISDWQFPAPPIMGAIWPNTTNLVDEWVMTTDAGTTYAVGQPNVFYDEVGAAAQAITLTLITHRLGWSPQVEQQFTRLDVVLNVTDNPTTVTVTPSVETSRQALAGLTAQTPATASGIAERHPVWGLKRNGRWMAVSLNVVATTTTSTRTYGVRQLAVAAVPMSVTPVLT